MLRLVGGQVESLLDELLPVEVRELPADLATLDRLLGDPCLLAPIEQAWEQTARDHGRPTIPMASFVRLMVVKQRTGWGYATLVRGALLHRRRPRPSGETAAMRTVPPANPYRAGAPSTHHSTADPGAGGPVGRGWRDTAGRVLSGRVPTSARRRPDRLDRWAALANRGGRRRRRRRPAVRHPHRPGRPVAGRAGGYRRHRVEASLSRLPADPGLARRRPRGAGHRPPAAPAGTPGLCGAARPPGPRQPREP
jgi:hypothetical protein